MAEEFHYEKHTLFAVRGTGGRTTQKIVEKLYPEDPLFGNFDQQVAAAVDTALWQTVDVHYPGDSGLFNGLLNMVETAAEGTRILIDLINKTPGKFAIVGLSQGAIVCSNVYDEIRYGSLKHRREDFLGGVVMGNLRRQTGFTIPGGVDPGVKRNGTPTHGALANDLLENCEPDLWWDFANSDDSAADVDDTARGRGITAILEFMYHNYFGDDSIIYEFWRNFGQGLQIGFQDAMGIAQALLDNLFRLGMDMIRDALGRTDSLKDGHLKYFLPYTNLPGNTTLSAIDLAVAHFNEVGRNNSFGHSLKGVPSLLDNLQSGDYRAATAPQIRDIMTRADIPQTVVTLYSKTYEPLGEIHDYLSLTCEFTRNAIDSATIVIKTTDPMAAVAMQCYETVVPVTIQIGSQRWSGRVDNFDYAMKDGVKTLTLQCMGDYAWFSKIMVWPNFLAPIQAQFPTRALFIGPAVTCIKTLVAEQCFRLQSGIWELSNNLLSLNLDWKAWFGNLLMTRGKLHDILLTPIVVAAGTGPLYDTSKWVSFNGRMDKISSVVEQVVKDNGLLLTADLWLPGDPQPEGMVVELRVPTIVVDVKDRSGITGPTGTFVDGIVTDVVDLQASVLGEVLSPFLNPGNKYAPEGVNIAPVLGVNFVKPWVIFHDHPRSGITEFHLFGHHPLAYTVIGGGKSPKWLNDLINATFEWMIDAISIVIGITGIPSDLLNGTFDDVLLAFQMMENFERRVKLGPYGWPEYFVQTGASAYTLDEWFALISAMWDSRGYHAVQIAFDNGFPYTFGKDLFVGSLASFACEGMLYTEYLEKVTFTDDRNTRTKIVCTIGDGKRHDNPIIKLQRNLTHFQEAMQIITLSSN